MPPVSAVGVPSSLSLRAARGVAWTGGGQILRQLIQVGTSIALVRLLSPDDFGLIGMAMFFVGLGQLLADFGVGSAILQSRTEDRVVLSSCFWLNVLVAGTLAALVLVCAPLIGRFYQRTDLAPVVAALSLNLLLSGLAVVPSALLSRDMRFSVIARAQVAGSLAGAVAAITLAWQGFGVWSLVAQPLCGAATSLAIFVVAQRWVPTFEFSWPKVAPLARFSAALLGTNLVGYANRNTDSLLVGRVLGAAALGFYAMAIQLMLYPLQQVSSVIVRVLIPTLVQIQDDLPRLRAAYLRAVGAIALVTFPIMGGLFALADDFVLVVFGASWAPMAPLLKVLAWVGMLQSVGTTVGTIYLATGTMGIALRVTLIGAPVLIGGMAAGLPWGIQGVAVGYAVATFSLFYYTAITAFRVIDLRLADFHAALLRPLASTFAMLAGLYALGLLTVGSPPATRLGAGVLGGALMYLAVSACINRAQLLEIGEVLRSLRHRAR